MKKILLLVTFFGLCITNVNAVSLVVCENIRKSRDVNVVAIDEGKKTINWDNKIIYNITEGDGFGTGDFFTEKLGDVWGIDKTGTRFFAINRFTYKATYREAGTGSTRNYNCRRADTSNMLF